jgi:hypothetical protein
MAAFLFLLTLLASVLFINCELVLNDVAERGFGKEIIFVVWMDLIMVVGTKGLQ